MTTKSFDAKNATRSIASRLHDNATIIISCNGALAAQEDIIQHFDEQHDHILIIKIIQIITLY